MKQAALMKSLGTGEKWGKGQEFELELVSVSRSNFILSAWW